MVAVVLHGPVWFFLLDAVLGFLGMAAAIVIVLLSAKALSLLQERKYLYFSLAYALIGFGLLIRAITNVLVFFVTPHIRQIVDLQHDRGTFFYFGYGSFIVCSVLGYVLLAVSTMKSREPRITLLLTLLVLLLLGISSSYFLSFYLSSAILLGFITYHVGVNFFQRKSFTAFAVFTSFFLQFTAQIGFLLEVTDQLFYYIANSALLGGYIILLFTLAHLLFKTHEHPKK